MQKKLTSIFESIVQKNILEPSNLQVNRIQNSVRQFKSLEPHQPQSEQLREIFGRQAHYPVAIGDHPDFQHLKDDDDELHYAVTVFLDIKGSTILCTRYPLRTVKKIKNGILATAIEIFQVFDGHIHRLQGDAIFAQFVRRGKLPCDAVIDALNAVTILQTFFRDTLIPIFVNDLGLPEVKTRVGIDYGAEDKVMWSRYGIANCNELTTTSIHTDLAAKMQGKASANGVIIGHNVVQLLDIPDEFYRIKYIQRNKKKLEDRYALETDDFTYQMWDFQWEKYVKKFANLYVKGKSNCPFVCPRDFQLRCYYSTDSVNWDEYIANSRSLPKGISLRFELKINRNLLKYTEIFWTVLNRGDEAKVANQLKFDMTDYYNKLHCPQTTAYLGHHYMRCTIKNQGRIVAQEYFGIYINSERIEPPSQLGSST